MQILEIDKNTFFSFLTNKDNKCIGQGCYGIVSKYNNNTLIKDIGENATGNEYKIEPIIIPGHPIILNPNILDIIPFAPNKLINPSPCDIDGINIGIVNNTFNTALCFIFVLFNV